MSQSTPPGPQAPRPQGQIETPNPVELFWEKNRRMIITAVSAAAFAIGLYYALEYMRQAEIDERWGAFATSANLDLQYTSPEVPAIAQFIQMPDPFPEQARSLINQLARQVSDADASALADAIQEAEGTPAEPLLIWLAAHQASGKREWDRAEAFLKDLQSRFPEHPLCVETEYPVQYRKPVEGEEPPDPPDPLWMPELEPAVSGSQVARALTRIQRDRGFQQSEARFYEPIAPAEDSTKVRVTTSLGTFTIALFDNRAPEHVAELKRLIGEAFFDGQHVDEIARVDTTFEPPVQEFHIGLKSSKSQIRTEWDRTAPAEDSEPLEYVDTPAQRELSHFPGTVSAAPEADGKSSAERYWINVNDCASSMDDTRVIVGRVIEGLDVLDLIVGAPFFTDAEATAGRGQPRELIRIEKVEIL